MGLLSALLTLPLAPVRGAVWIAEQVANEAERQLYDEQQIRSELMLLELEAEEQGLGHAEVQAREDELMRRLAVSQAREAAANAPEGTRGGEWDG